jgi:SAM-dependent methyltransferase
VREDGLMASAEGEYRLYRDLAQWWPLISPTEEYAGEAAYLAAVLKSAEVPVRHVLDLGSGGGHIAVHVKDSFSLTLLDISPDMLEVSRRLNPECEHLQGDMRTARLGRTFDAVLVHDAVDYITSTGDLRQVIETAFAHCRPGGIALFVPDYVKDTFGELTGAGGGGTDGSGRQGSFVERTWDPDPADDWVQAEYELTLREADGTVEVVHETHRLGAFSRAQWQRLLLAAGFEPDAARAVRPAGRMPGNLFAGRKPVPPGLRPDRRGT